MGNVIGTLGYMLGKWEGKFVGDVYPSFKALRDVKVYRGGVQHRGNSMAMLHRRSGFSDNRYDAMLS